LTQRHRFRILSAFQLFPGGPRHGTLQRGDVGTKGDAQGTHAPGVESTEIRTSGIRFASCRSMGTFLDRNSPRYATAHLEDGPDGS
jgi:hypothetical protein